MLTNDTQVIDFACIHPISKVYSVLAVASYTSKWFHKNLIPDVCIIMLLNLFALSPYFNPRA